MSEESNKQSWADPGFVGLMALAAAVFSLWPILTGDVPSSAAPMVIGWMFVTGVALIICGVICLKLGNLIVGAPCLVFGAVVNLGTGAAFALELYGAAHDISVVGAPLNGWVFLVIGFLAVAIGLPLGKLSWAMFVWVMDLAVTFWVIGLSFIGVLGPSAVKTGGWLLLIFGILCLYFAFAGHVNTTFGKAILPLGKPLFRPSAGRGKNAAPSLQSQ